MKTTLIGNIVKITPHSTVVAVERTKIHPIYSKRFTVTKKFHAENPQNIGETGTRVVIGEIKPMSKTKYWQVIKLAKKES